ncbi:MAG: nucleotidyltransferase domain-containing protein [Sulfurimonas sp.]|nr:nucleotidyltransferase domain-containing protein [Sulfurimonas sp.]
MIDIQILKPLIVNRLKKLDPQKIILFGSYAYCQPNEDSDIDLFLVKDIDKTEARQYKIEARKSIRDLASKYKVSFDFIVASETFINNRSDYFYKKEVLEKGKVIYGSNI